MSQQVLNRIARIALWIAAPVAFAAATPALAQSEQQKLVDAANTTLSNFLRDPEMTWLQRSLHDLRIDVAALSRAEESIADALVRSARHFPLLSRVRHAARGASAFVDWFERGSHDFRTTRRTPSAARELSDALFYLIPNGVALTILIVAIGFAVFLALQFELSLESLVIAPLPRFGDATSFDVLFRFGVLTLTGLTAWAVYRLAVVWTAIPRILDYARAK